MAKFSLLQQPNSTHWSGSNLSKSSIVLWKKISLLSLDIAGKRLCMYARSGRLIIIAFSLQRPAAATAEQPHRQEQSGTHKNQSAPISHSKCSVSEVFFFLACYSLQKRLPPTTSQVKARQGQAKIYIRGRALGSLVD